MKPNYETTPPPPRDNPDARQATKPRPASYYLLAYSPAYLVPLALYMEAAIWNTRDGRRVGNDGSAVPWILMVGAVAVPIVAFLAANRTVAFRHNPGAWVGALLGILFINGCVVFGGCVVMTVAAKL